MKPSRKTTTILNRFITYTPNWWAKLSGVFTILVLLISCEEEFLLGFKGDQKKFKVNYVEIPITSSVLWMDSLSTKNQYFTGETTRMLVGSYTDEVFGKVDAQAMMQFRPTSVNTSLAPGAVFDSLVLSLRYDFYSYGSTGQTIQTYTIHELTDELFSDENYYANSNISLSAEIIGNAIDTISHDFFKAEYTDSDRDSVLTLRVKLSNNFTSKLFNFINPEDENYYNFELFKSFFKGIAIVPKNSDKILGLNPNDANSAMILYYHEGDTKKTMSFLLSSGVTFSKIITDRTSSEIADINLFHSDFSPSNKRYIQNGSSLITKVDITEFYNYFDTIPNAVINSVELSINEVDGSSDYPIPQRLGLTALRTNNKFKRYILDQDSIDFITLANKVRVSSDLDFVATEDQGEVLAITYSTSKKSFLGYPTLFFQHLYDVKDNAQFKHWALRPTNPQPGKSVDRFSFDKDKLKLKVYYTRPTVVNP